MKAGKIPVRGRGWVCETSQQKFFQMSVVVSANPSGGSCSISCKLCVLLHSATQPFTEAHANSYTLFYPQSSPPPVST